MPLTQTQALVNLYGKSIKDGSITTEDLLKLLNTTFGESQIWYDIQKPVSDTNHDNIQASCDFVQNICKTLSPENLHKLISHMLNLSPMTDNFDFHQMLSPNLALVFLAYEMLYEPKLAQSHFETDLIKNLFPTSHAIKRFKDQEIHTIITELQIIAMFPKLPRAIGAYELALHNLEYKRISEYKDSPICGCIQALITTVKSFAFHESSPNGTVVNLMIKTANLLDGQISVQEYRRLAQNIPKSIPTALSSSMYSNLALETAIKVTGALSQSLPSHIIAKSASFFGGPLLRSQEKPTDFFNLINQIADYIVNENQQEQASTHDQSDSFLMVKTPAVECSAADEGKRLISSKTLIFRKYKAITQIEFFKMLMDNQKHYSDGVEPGEKEDFAEMFDSVCDF